MVDSLNNIDNRLTIILTLKDRENLTYRWLDYVNKINLPYKIYIADGGKNSNVKSFLSENSTISNLDYEYKKYPYDENMQDFRKKIIDALNKIKTPYFIFADNDDFILISGLKKSLNFIINNREYSCAKGKIGFVNVESKNYDKDKFIYGDDNKYWIPESLNIKERTSLERFKSFLHNYSQKKYYSNFYYGINRTSEFKGIIKSTFKFELEDIFLEELTISGLVAINGNVESDDHLYLIRQRNTPTTASSTFSEKFGNEFDRMFLDNWSKDFSNFVKIISESIIKVDGLNTIDVKNEVIDTYKKYIAPTVFNRIRKKYIGSTTIEKPSIRNSIFKRFQKSVPRNKKFIRIDFSEHKKILRPIEKLLSRANF